MPGIGNLGNTDPLGPWDPASNYPPDGLLPSSRPVHGGHGRSLDNFGSTASSLSGTSVNSAVASSSYSGFDSYLDLLREISRENNAFNLKQTEMVNAFNAEEALKNRDWQERMSNTAHQREVQDLIKAGLNPVLSAMNGQGAFTGSGSAAEGQKAVADNTLGNGVISLMSSMLNAQSALTVANVHASASRYSADSYAASQSAYREMMSKHYEMQTGVGFLKSLIPFISKLL